MLTTHRHDRRVRRQAGILLESLDDRLLLSGGATVEAVVHYQPANHAQGDHRSRPRDVLAHGSPAALPSNVSPALRSLYLQYEDQRGGSGFAPSQPGSGPLVIRGARVAVQIKVAFPPALGAYVSKLRADGLQVTRTVPADGLAEGMLPIAKLRAVAQLAAHVWPAPLAITTQLHPRAH